MKLLKPAWIFLFFLAFPIPSFATWSIIIIDSGTKEIGIAGASCTYNCYGIGQIVPGKGAIIVQAMSNKEARDKGLEMIEAGFSPAKIVAALRDPIYDPERQQYAVVCLNYPNDPATYTGATTHPHRGTLTASGVSVQVNTLTTENELKAIVKGHYGSGFKGATTGFANGRNFDACPGGWFRGWW